MPPYPWHFGGQSNHNLFVDASEISKFCSENDVRICLDVRIQKWHVPNTIGSYLIS